ELLFKDTYTVSPHLAGSEDDTYHECAEITRVLLLIRMVSSFALYSARTGPFPEKRIGEVISTPCERTNSFGVPNCAHGINLSARGSSTPRPSKLVKISTNHLVTRKFSFIAMLLNTMEVFKGSENKTSPEFSFTSSWLITVPSAFDKGALLNASKIASGL